MTTYTKFPYRVEFPNSSEGTRRSQTLEDALNIARWTLHRVWKEDWEGGRRGEPTTDAETAIITNRYTGYRWILRRSGYDVEFQTAGMLEELVASQTIEVFLTVEEAEALARAAKAGDVEDRRTRALADQALDQIAAICRRVRERVGAGDKILDRWASSIPRRRPPAGDHQDHGPEEQPEPLETHQRPFAPWETRTTSR